MDDDSFIFEEDDRAENRNDGVYHTPDYILGGILAGLYYLPPEYILKEQSGWGRKIRYSSYQRLPAAWSPICMKSAHHETLLDQFFDTVEVMRVDRTLVLNQALSVGTFRIYKFRVKTNIASSINEALFVYSKTIETSGISVSNAGGFHSQPDLFSIGSNDVADLIGSIASSAANFAEWHDFQETSVDIHDRISAAVGNSNSPEMYSCRNRLALNRLRSLQASLDSEAWINVNKHGHWNRLHTHEGAAWSGVYYVKCPTEFSCRSYGGNLLLKPTPHQTEDKHKLTDIELSRLRMRLVHSPSNENCTLETLTVTNPTIYGPKEEIASDCSAHAEGVKSAQEFVDIEIGSGESKSDIVSTHEETLPLPECDREAGSGSCSFAHLDMHAAPNACLNAVEAYNDKVCQYLELCPEEGTITLFPSWLHHGVVPLAIQREHRETAAGMRVSIAFNFSEIE